MTEPRTIQDFKELYRADFEWLLQTIGAHDLRQIVEDFIQEAELLARGMSPEDIQRIQETWGKPYEHEYGPVL